MVVIVRETFLVTVYVCVIGKSHDVLCYGTSTTERNAYVVVVVSRSGHKWGKLTEKETVIE
jgi:hypothetical protein